MAKDYRAIMIAMRARFLPGALQKHRFKQAAGDPLEAISILTDPSIPEESNLADASDAGRLADPSAVTDSTLDSGRTDSSANLSTSPFAISLDFFSGPMDLLLHLVHQQELPIEQVSMKQLAEQYLAVITSSSVLDLDLASEYLVIAATLLSLKSESLLPNHSGLNGEELPIEERSEAFYEELRARLQAYEQTKHQARLLMETPQLGADVFTRVDRKALLPTPEMLAEPEEPSALALLFGRLLKRVGEGMRSFHVRLDSISVVSYMMKILDSFSVSLPTSGGNNSTISALTDPATEALVSASRISA